MKDASAGSSFETTLLAVSSACQRLVVSWGCGDVIKIGYTCEGCPKISCYSVGFSSSRSTRGFWDLSVIILF
jgi:hypothetical protein